MVSMKDEDFEKTMDNWASREAESAPQMRPTEEMYRAIETRKRKSLFSVHGRRILVGVAFVCLVLSAIVVPVIFYSSDRDVEPSIGLRKVIAPKSGFIVKHPPKRRGKGPKKGAISFQQLMFQYQKSDSPSVYELDIRFPVEEKVTLTADDSYRLVMQTAGERYVYVYQLDSLGRLMNLFPNDVYSSIQNPLDGEQIYHVPSDPDWFHLSEKKGEERIHVVAAAQPMQRLEELYGRYDKADSRGERREALSQLLKELDEEPTIEDAVVWRFMFSHE
jgi:hypothetical protein